MALSFSAIAAVIIIAVLLILFMNGYRKAPPDVAYIISGITKKPRILIGRAGVMIPGLERLNKMYLGQITIDVVTEEYVSTNEFIDLRADAVIKVRLSTKQELIDLAMRNFIDMAPEKIAEALRDSLQGNLREIIGQMGIKDIIIDREKFANQVMSSAEADMASLGVEIISCNIQSITSNPPELISNMGIDNTARIKKDAEIAKAQAERDVEIATAQAQKESQTAQIESQTAIAERDNELQIKKAQLQALADIERAKAAAAGQIQEREQQKAINVAEVNAKIAEQEREVEYQKTAAEVAEQKLSAEVRKKADADRYAAQQESEVTLFRKQKEAEAVAYAAEQEALAAKAKADATKYSLETEAAGVRAQGIAEADATRAKLEAEAAGIDKKAEAMKKYGSAAIVEMLCKAYPEIAKSVAEPLSKVDKITMYGEGNNAKLVGDIVNTASKVISGVSESFGIDAKKLTEDALGNISENRKTSDAAADGGKDTASGDFRENIPDGTEKN